MRLCSSALPNHLCSQDRGRRLSSLSLDRMSWRLMLGQVQRSGRSASLVDGVERQDKVRDRPRGGDRAKRNRELGNRLRGISRDTTYGGNFSTPSSATGNKPLSIEEADLSLSSLDSASKSG